MSELRFAGKKVIVTGATRGIGRAIAEAFLNEGADLWGSYAANEEAAEQFKKECEEKKLALRLSAFDVADYSSCERFFAELDQAEFIPEILINNSGIRRDAILAMMPEADWQRVLAVNLGGSFNMSKLAVQRMSRQKKGRVIMIISPMGRLGFAGQANYAASKAGQEALAKSLSKEVGSRKITVNCVSPGFIDTELLDDLGDEKRMAYKAMPALKRFGKPEEVASAVLYLASEEAAYITGSTLEVHGGL